MTPGLFIISLDFELHWGVSETKTVNDYKENLDHTREAIIEMLALFKEYEIHVTWATVGFLFCKDKEDILSLSRNIVYPKYKNTKLSNYHLLTELGKDYNEDPYHYGNDVLPLIQACPNQEIGTHTFSHFYCLEEGPTFQDFAADLDLALEKAEKYNITLNSIVFPRNQYSKEHLEICLKKGIHVYRGNSTNWLYKTSSSKEQHFIRRGARLLDSYLNLSGMNSFFLKNLIGDLYNIPGSRFLRPYNSKLKLLEKIRLRRIKKEMTYAAKNKKLYHLWWHPHNFGKNLSKNIAFLKEILDHFIILKNKYGFTSLNMSEVPFFKTNTL